MQKKYFIILAALSVVVIGLSAWTFIQRGNQQSIVQSPPPVALRPPLVTSSTQSEATSTFSGPKTYRNDQWGFEFQYPREWSFFPNMFGSPFSKFNLIGASPSDEESGHPDPIDPPLLVNIVTPDFADRAFYDLRGVDTIVGGVAGKKYEYEFEHVQQVDTDIPFGQYRIILGTKKKYEDIFNQILATFKFLK